MATKLIRGFLSILGGKFGALIIGVLTTPILVRLLGSGGYGDYAFFTALLATITTVTAVGGVTSGVRKFIVEDRSFKRWESHVFAFYFRFSIGTVVIAATVIIAYIWSGLAQRHFGAEFAPYFYLLVLMTISDQLYQLVRATLMGFSMEPISETFSVVKKGTYALVALLLVYYGAGVSGALAGQFAGAAVGALGCLLFLSRKVNLSCIFSRTPDSFPRRELLSFNFASLVLLFCMESLYQIDILLLQPLAGSEQTGYYRAALVIAEFLWFVPHAAQLVLLHSMSDLWNKGQSGVISERASVITRYTLLITTLFVIGLATLAEPFVELYYGSEFSPTVLPLLLLLPGTLGFAAARPLLSTGQASGRMRYLIFSTGVAAIINLLLNIALIPSYGMYGAAVATSIGYGSMFILHVWSARQIGFNPLLDLRAGRIAVCGLVTASVILPISSILNGTILRLLIVPPVGFIVFVSVALKIGAISESESNRIQKSISKHIPADIRDN